MRGFKLRYASLPSLLVRLRSAAPAKPREKVKQIRFTGRSFFNTKSFAPRHPARFPLLKTFLISSLPARRSSFRKRKEPLASVSIRLFLVRNRQFIPSLSSAAFENQPSASCFHFCAKPELAVPLYFAGLISPFHGIVSCLYIRFLKAF